MNIQGIGQGYAGMTTQMMNRNQGGGDPANMDVGQLIEKDDQNADGVLSLEETPLSEDMFTSADTDGDGFLTQEEMEEMLASGPPPAMGGGMPMGGPGGGGAPDFDSLLAEEDTDGDGTISAEESALSEEMFANFDADGDGLITQEEFDNMAPPEEIEDDLNRNTAISAYQDAVSQFMAYQNVDENALLSTLI